MKLWLSKCSVIIIYLFINMYNFELLVHHLTHLTHHLTPFNNLGALNVGG